MSDSKLYENKGREKKMSIVDAIGLGIRKLYTEKKAMADFETIKKESGLKELD